MKSLFSCKLLYLVFCLTLIGFLVLCTACEGEKAEEDTHAVILLTSDLHGNTWGYSYEDNAETTNNGMSRVYTYVQKVRDENPIVFLVDAGDDIQGTIMTDEIANKNPDQEHPVMAAMNRMGYDSMTVGNHEFDWGINNMLKILGQADFPVLGANVLDKDGNYVTGDGWTIIDREGVKLAVIGVCTPSVPITDGEKEGLADTTFEAANEAVQKAMDEIGDQADIILVSAHMGQFAEFDEDGGSDAGEKIIEDNPDVDILQVAHMHITVDDEINGTPVVGVRNSGGEVVRVDVTLGPDKNIKDISTEIVDMEDYEPSEEIREIPVVKELHKQTINYVEGIDENGRKGKPLGVTTAKFQPEDEIRGLPEGRLKDTAVMNLILNIMLINSGADVAGCSLFNDTGDLPEGDINYGNIFNIYKYGDTLCTVDVTGKELKNYMEWTAGYYNQWEPGDINISFDPEYPSYMYDMFAGIDYEIDLSRPKGERIKNVMFRGEPLEDDRILKLAVNHYRYESGLKAQNLVKEKRSWESSKSIRDMIVEYFAENSPVEPTVDNNWCIVGVDLSGDDPRRAEIIGYINEGLLPTPYNRSCNLVDYDELVAEAQANRAAGKTVEDQQE